MRVRITESMVAHFAPQLIWRLTHCVLPVSFQPWSEQSWRRRRDWNCKGFGSEQDSWEHRVCRRHSDLVLYRVVWTICFITTQRLFRHIACCLYLFSLCDNNLGKEGGIEIGKALAVNTTVKNIKYAVATLTLCFIESLGPSVLGQRDECLTHCVLPVSFQPCWQQSWQRRRD